MAIQDGSQPFLIHHLSLSCNHSFAEEWGECVCLFFISRKPESVMISEIDNRKFRWILVEDSFIPHHVFFCGPFGKEVPPTLPSLLGSTTSHIRLGHTLLTSF